MDNLVSDGELVAAARAGDADALATLYDRYFPPLYDFLARMLRDRHAAADVAQDSFVRAIERLGQLRKPARFRSWLFSIAYRLGLDHAGGRSAAVPTEPDDPVLAEVDESALGDPAREAGVAETGRFVWEMAAGLDPKSYAVMHLHVRLGLGSAEIADVLGVTKGNAYTMVSRMKSTLADTIGAYLLLRRGTGGCDELAGIAATANVPPMTRDVRRIVVRHAKGCETCADTRAKLLSPSAVFGALVMVPLPAALPGGVLAGASTAAAGGTAVAAASGSGSGGIVQAARSNPGATAGVAAAAVLAAVLAAVQLTGGTEPPAAAEVLGVTVEQDAGGGDAPLAAAADPAPAPPAEAAPAPATTPTTVATTTSTTATTAAPASTAPPTAAPAPSSTTTAPPGTSPPPPAAAPRPPPPAPPAPAPPVAPAPTSPPTTTPGTPSPPPPAPTTTTSTAPPSTSTTTTTTPTTTTTQPPATNPPDLGSGSHPIGVPSSDTVIVVRWTPVSGAQGYSVSWSGDPTGSPDTVVDLPGSAGQATSPVLTPGTWFFHIRTRGPGGDWSATAHLGPFVIVPPALPPVIGAAHAAPPAISEQGCSPSSTNVIAAGITDPDGDLAGATLTWAIAGAGGGTVPMDLGVDNAKATLAFGPGTIGPLQSPATVSLEVTVTDAAGLSASAATTLVLLDCP